VIDNDTIDVGEADGFVWVRIHGKGSFATSPQLKGFVEERMGVGESRFVVDLESCPAMDSTFMGTLAGIAMRLSKVAGGKFQVAGTSDRNRQSLEDLGLDVLIEINPEGEEWSGHIGEVRSRLEPLESQADESDAGHVLEAHRLLCEANESNLHKFATVLDVLEKDLGDD
jgi:anti-sigma B factor antagonist